jgi:hypothetical protein
MLLSKLLATYSFDYWNFDDSVILFFGEYVSIMGIYISLGYYATKLLQRYSRPGKECQR